ncbi:MAG TPA: response regulator [Gemmatimonadaceae bacterium]|nr:response regulator [Gemmatimonadaceae bacterium]
MIVSADVLLVEDNPADAEFVLESLRGALAGRLLHLHDGAIALDYLFHRGAYADSAETLPALVLLDIKLPKVDGFTVLREIKGDPRTQRVPVVMLTSSNVERDVSLCYALGVNSYIQKPMDFDAFRSVVRTIGQYWLSTNIGPTAGGAIP